MGKREEEVGETRGAFLTVYRQCFVTGNYNHHKLQYPSCLDVGVISAVKAESCTHSHGGFRVVPSAK